jgi:hypothetical protein
MQIREVFATHIQARIEPVVKVGDRDQTVVAGELSSLVITPQWERYLHNMLSAYSNAADSEDEQGIGIWISGFFGSGKSLLMKVLGTLLQGGEIAGDSVHAMFLQRLPTTSPDRRDLERFLAICARKISTSSVGGNLHAEMSGSSDPLALIAFRLFARDRGHSDNWPLAWAVEQQIDLQGLTEQFHQQASTLAGTSWAEVAGDAAFYAVQLYEAAAAVLPEHFAGGAAAVEQTVRAVTASGITPSMVIDRFRRWCERQDSEGKRHKLLLQLDEIGQWISSGNSTERLMQVQALVEQAAIAGAGRIWIAVTAHGDVQAVSRNVRQEEYAKINQRFAQELRCKLSNEDINQVVEERLLRKTQPARTDLLQRFAARSGEIADIGSVQGAQRVYPVPDSESFPLFYPYMPWTVSVIPDVVKGIAQAASRGEELTGSTRTMIGVVQGAVIETPGLLDSQVGRLLSLSDLYDQLASDVPIETKTDLNRIRETVSDATALTTQVARALFLLGEAEYIPCTLDNVTRSIVGAMDANLAALRPQVKAELARLITAGYAKEVGDQYNFLSTQQRSFQDKVRARQGEIESQTYELSQALKEYESDDAFRFDRVPLQGRETLLKLDLDGRIIRNPTATVTVHVYSPFQRVLDPQIADDAQLKQRSNGEPDDIFLRMAEAPGLHGKLALAVATDEVANREISANPHGPNADVARQARQHDLATYQSDVRRLLGASVRSGTIFFRGTSYEVASGGNPGEAVRGILAQLLPSIYPRFIAHRIANEETAVRAALNDNTTNGDLQALGIYRSDGTVNEANELISTLRGRLPSDDGPPVNAELLRSEFQSPPFGWDGNCVKVGLAVLLRGSYCQLIDNGRLVNDPTDPDALQLLVKEQRFKSVRVQKTAGNDPLSMSELKEVQGYLSALFGTKPILQEAALNNALGDGLTEVATRAGALQTWAQAAQCPLPIAFESSNSLVQEMLDNSVAPTRLRRFLEQAETLTEYLALLDRLEMFQREQARRFATLRDFFQGMINAPLDVPELRTFIGDWSTLIQERSVTETSRWNEIGQTYDTARQALDDQAEAWRKESEQKLAEIEASQPRRAEKLGVPPDRMEEALTRLRAPFAAIRERLSQPNIDAVEARGILTALSAEELDQPRILREVQALYAPQQLENEAHLRLDQLVRQTRISSFDDLEHMLGELRTAIQRELEQQKIVILS